MASGKTTAEDEEALEALPEEEEEDGTPVRTSTTSQEEVLEMMTTWGGGVEAVAVALVTEGVEVQGWVATETDPHAEERQTSGNRLKRSVHSGLGCS